VVSDVKGVEMISVFDLLDNYKKGRLYHIFGSAKVGKTHLAVYHHIIRRMIDENVDESKIDRVRNFVVCCDGGFSEDRLLDLAEKYQLKPSLVKQSLVVFYPQEFREAIAKVMEDIPSIKANRSLEVLTISVDGLLWLYREQWRDVDRKQILEVARRLRPLLTSAFSKLSRLSVGWDCSATITDIRKSVPDFIQKEKEVHPFYGGEDLVAIAWSTIELKKISDQGEYVAKIYSSRSKPRGIAARYLITEKGIETPTTS